MMAERGYDIVMVDPYLTGGVLKDGCDLIKNVLVQQPAANVIVLTGYSSPELAKSTADRKIAAPPHQTAVHPFSKPIPRRNATRVDRTLNQRTNAMKRTLHLLLAVLMITSAIGVAEAKPKHKKSKKKDTTIDRVSPEGMVERFGGGEDDEDRPKPGTSDQAREEAARRF